MKFDAPSPAGNELAGWLAGEVRKAHRSPVIVAGSVVAGEEDAVLDAFARVRGQFPKALLVLAPRKPERFAAAAALVEARGWGLMRRSQLDHLAGPLDAGVFLLDSIGELGGLYRVADLVFVGGSLLDAGGHNILEPASLGKAPIFGPHMQNFREIARTFLASGAAMQVSTADELGRVWLDCFLDEARREAAGRSARELVESNRGATERVVRDVEALVGADGQGQ